MTLLETTTAEGALKGMVTARAPHELTDQEVAYLQDAIINQPGFVNRRGAITGTTAITAANLDSARPSAVCTITDPGGTQKIGIFYLKDNGAAYELWVSVYTTAFAFVQKHFIRTISGTYPNRKVLLQVVPAIDGSVIVSIRQSYGHASTTSSSTMRWYGGCPTNSIPNSGFAGANATLVATEGSTAVTGGVAEIAKVSFPGTVIVGTGVVASVTSTTQVELVYPSPISYGATAKQFFVGEMLPVMRARGRVSCATGVLTGVVGYGTKFTEFTDSAFGGAAAAPGFEILDAGSMKLLASLTTPAILNPSDTVSAAPTAVPRSGALKAYLMYGSGAILYPGMNRFQFPHSAADFDFHTPKTARGSFWAIYKGLMFSFNAAVSSLAGKYSGDVAVTSRGYIHGPRFPEIMDHSAADGDWFEVQSTKPGDPDGIAAQGGSNGVLFCKAQESFLLSGDDADNFTLNKIADDGALSFESTSSWRGQPIWLGRTGIWMYDGAGAKNIIENTLGSRWLTLVAAFDGTSTAQDSDVYLLNQARCFVYKDYLFVNVTNTGSQHTVYTDGVARTSNTMQLCIYLPTMAVSFLSNFNFQGFLQLGNAGYVVLPQLGSTTHHWFPLDNLFTQGLATVDTILTANSYNSGSVPTSVGPWFHLESRKYDLGDGLRRKTWKQLSLEYLMTNTKRMFLETVPGLNTTGTRQTTPYVGTGLFKAFKNKFNARDQYMSYRLYEDINNRPASLQLGAWQWAYKLARRGQV